MQAFTNVINAEAELRNDAYRKEALAHVRSLITMFRITNSEIEDVVITRKKRNTTTEDKAEKTTEAKPKAA